MAMDIGGIETYAGQHIGIHGRAKGKVPAHTDADRPQAAGTIFKSSKIVEVSSCLAVIGRNRFAVFVSIALVGAGQIVSQHRSGGLELVIDLRNCDDVTMAGDKGGKATDRAGSLKDL